MFNEEQQKAIETIKGQLILVAAPAVEKRQLCWEESMT